MAETMAWRMFMETGFWLPSEDERAAGLIQAGIAAGSNPAARPFYYLKSHIFRHHPPGPDFRFPIPALKRLPTGDTLRGSTWQRSWSRRLSPERASATHHQPPRLQIWNPTNHANTGRGETEIERNA